VDNWDDAIRTTALLHAGRPAFDAEHLRQGSNYTNRRVALIYSETKAGAFSLAPSGSGDPAADGFAFDDVRPGRRDLNQGLMVPTRSSVGFGSESICPRAKCSFGKRA